MGGHVFLLCKYLLFVAPLWRLSASASVDAGSCFMTALIQA